MCWVSVVYRTLYSNEEFDVLRRLHRAVRSLYSHRLRISHEIRQIKRKIKTSAEAKHIIAV